MRQRVLIGMGALLFSAGSDGIRMALESPNLFWGFVCLAVGFSSVLIGVFVIAEASHGRIVIKE